LSINDFSEVDKPTSFICAEEDMAFPHKLRDQAYENIKAKGVPTEKKVYPGTVHGFALRPNLSIPEVKSAFQDAVVQAADWFKAHL